MATRMQLTPLQLQELCSRRIETTKRSMQNTGLQCMDNKECQAEKMAYDLQHACHSVYQSWLLEEWLMYLVKQKVRLDNVNDPSSKIVIEGIRHPNIQVEYILVIRDSHSNTYRHARTIIHPALPSDNPNRVVTTMAIVEYVMNADKCLYNGEVCYNVILAVYDNEESRIAVVPMSERCAQYAQDLPWSRILEKPYSQLTFQLGKTPYISFLWIHTTLDYIYDKQKENKDMGTLCMAAVLGHDQCDQNGYFTYRVAMLDALLPKETERWMPEHLARHSEKRVRRAESMSFNAKITMGSTRSIIEQTSMDD